MNLVFLFLTRDDLDSIPRISQWINEQGPVEAVIAFVNPHLAINPTPDQVELENRILAAMRSTIVPGNERMELELVLDKRWRQIPRDRMLDHLDSLFAPMGGISTKTGLNVLTECFTADRLPELLTKIRPAWPRNIPLGKYILVFPNQIPEPRPVGRPPGKVMDPETKKRLQASLAKAREIKKQKKLEAQKQEAVTP